MSIKNQKTLFISAFAIIALTVVGLIVINYVVEKISQITPNSFVQIPSRQPANMHSTDDAINNKKAPFDMPYNDGPSGLHNQPPPGFFRADGREKPPPDVMRRMRHGKDTPDIKRMNPHPPKVDRADSDQRATPRYPSDIPNPRSMPPTIPNGTRPNPADRESIEQEMQRRRELFYGPPDGPPPGYYPPSGFDDLNGPEDDYDYDADIEGRRKDIDTQNPTTTKLTSASDLDVEDYEDDGDYTFLEDEYLFDYVE
jgi:hypothetical protein